MGLPLLHSLTKTESMVEQMLGVPTGYKLVRSEQIGDSAQEGFAVHLYNPSGRGVSIRRTRREGNQFQVRGNTGGAIIKVLPMTGTGHTLRFTATGSKGMGLMQEVEVDTNHVMRPRESLATETFRLAEVDGPGAQVDVEIEGNHFSTISFPEGKHDITFEVLETPSAIS